MHIEDKHQQRLRGVDEDVEEGKEQVHSYVSVLVLVQLEELSLWERS
jgi:hypothetical protein